MFLLYYLIVNMSILSSDFEGVDMPSRFPQTIAKFVTEFL